MRNESNQNKKLKAALEHNLPVLILGKAGTAKTATVNAIAKELGLPVVTLPLAGIAPEDIGGMPRPNDPNNPTAFRYLAPEWFDKYRDQPFVLFLDEFNQATLDTMHAMYYLVNDRTTAGQSNPQMRIVAAGNTLDENEFLTPIPDPLRDRFPFQLKWQCDLESSLGFLEDKYKDHDATKPLIEAIHKSPHDDVTPRHVEQALLMAIAGVFDVERGRELIGSAYDVYVESLSTAPVTEENGRLRFLAGIREKLKAPKYTPVNGEITKIDRSALLEGLTEEEIELVTNHAG